MAPPRISANLHRIGRIRFDLTGASEAALLDLRTQIAGTVEEILPSALAGVLDDVAGPEEVLEIDRLEVDLGRLAAGAFDPMVVAAATRRALARMAPPSARSFGADAAVDSSEGMAPAEAAGTSDVRRRPIAFAALDAVIAYLLTGEVGPRSPADDLASLFAALSPSTETANRLLAAIRDAPAAARGGAALRLVAVAPPSFLSALLAAGPEAVAAAFGDARSVEREAAAAQQSTRVREAFVDRLVAALLEGEPPQHGRPAPAARAPSKDEDAEVGTPAPNAGVVLLHPFLPRLFGFCDLVEEGRFPSVLAHATATRLVHYLATGETTAPEPVLVIPRLLCAVPPEMPVLPLDPLAPELLEKADALVAAAIGHWTKLGNASPEGLRETFLTRPGLLKGPPDRRRMVVERRGVDVLLRALPWGIDPVRLPWLPAPVPVDWA